MSSTPLPTLLLRQLAQHGPMAPSELARRLETTLPTLSGHLEALGPRVLRVGRTRQARVAGVRELEGLPPALELGRIDEEGRPQRLGALHPLSHGGCAVVWEPGITAAPFSFFPGVPWFLEAARPQGFLGRAFARRFGLPSPGNWSADQLLGVLVAHGGDLSGDLFLTPPGSPPPPPPEPLDLDAANLRETEWPRRAQASLEGEIGSSVEGEQPKFTLTVRREGQVRHLLVKYASPSGDAAAVRWSDLLVCEHLALQTLREAGHPAAATRVLQVAGRTFLEVERFDRVGAAGRRGLAPLRCLAAEFVGLESPWSRAVEALRAERLVNLRTLAETQLLEAFSLLVGNSDTHAGNLAFHWRDPSGPFELAPAYDVLPMALAPRPSVGDVMPLPRLDPSFPSCPPHLPRARWEEARRLARTFWNRCADDDRLSRGFREGCVAPYRRAVMG